MENQRKYSTIEIIAITLASTDKTLDGYYYSKAVSYMFAKELKL